MLDMSHDFFETNLSLLKKCHHDIWQMLIATQPETVGEIFFSNTGQPNLKVIDHAGNITNLHIAEDPEAEIPQFLGLIKEKATDVVALFGMGLGYTPLAILQQRPYIRHLIVFEAEPGIFIQALHCIDFTQLLTDSRLTIILGGPHHDLEPLLSHTTLAIELENVQILKHQTAISLNNDKYFQLDKHFNDFVTAHKMDANTKIGKGKILLRNHIQNLQSIHKQHLFEEMLLLFQEVPAFLVAAGPSLDDNIHLLKKARNKSIIICVDSALAALMHHGITPNFVTSLEYNEFNTEKLAPFALQSNGISLVCMPQINPQVPKTFPADNVFWLFTQAPTNTWINKILGGTIFTGGTGTVAHLNIISAIILGCSPIVFVGQDLAYTSLRDHTEHALLGYPEDIEKIIASQDTLRVEGINGTMLPTRHDFYTYKNMFEQIIGGNPGHYINSSANGAHIEGTEVLSLKKVIDIYCTRNIDIRQIINSHISLDNTQQSRLLKELKNILQEVANIKNLINKLSHLIGSTEKGLKKIKSIKSNYPTISTLPENVKNTIETIDQISHKIDNAETIWELLAEITLEGMREQERMQHALIIKQQSPEHFSDWLPLKFQLLTHSNNNKKQALIVLEQSLIETIKFYKTETKYSKEIKRNKNLKENLTNLARFYMKSSNYTLAKPVLDKLLSMTPVSPEIYFFMGTIASSEMRFSDTNRYFDLAIKDDKKYENRVQKLRTTMADKYIALKEECENGQETADRATSRRLLVRGYKYCNNHPQIISELKRIFQADIKDATNLFDNNYDKCKIIIDDLTKDLNNNPGILSCFASSQLAKFYHLQGKVSFTEKDYQQSITAINKALTFSPQAADCFFLLAQCYFYISDFDNGIVNLNKAIAYDNSYAKHWEVIGDILYEANDHSSAISAYEQCFQYFPEQIDLIKKIGACYLASGQLEAAQEAYNQVKSKLTSPPVC